ncbi:MAG: DUF4035 domain-containing protein [bacterium]|nr:DUF4035 domain-containing protein [bacterium]
MTRADLVRRMSREELTEWIAFSQLEPFGAEFDEYLSALIASVVAEVNRNRKKRGKPFSPKEFMQHWGRPDPDKASTPEAMADFVKQFTARMHAQKGVDMQKPAILDQHGRPVSSGS